VYHVEERVKPAFNSSAGRIRRTFDLDTYRLVKTMSERGR
jgi:hypothetical protein